MTTLKLTSPAFQANGTLPVDYTCEGRGISPALAWEGVPAGAKSLALIVDDPDAPDPKAPRVVWVHWVVYNIPASVHGLAAGASAHMPAGALDGVNDWKKPGYGGACPPVGRHRYFHKLYALDVVLPDMHRPTRSQLEKAMSGHVLAKAELIGTYQKSK